MKTRVIVTAMMLFLTNALFAQVNLGTIMGRVYDKDSVLTKPFAKVWVESEGGPIGVAADVDGRYKIDALKPGVYILHARSVDRGEVILADIHVNPDAITQVDVYLSNDNMLKEVIVDWGRPKIDTDIPKLKISTEDIENSPFIRSPMELLAGTSSDIKMDEGSDQPIIRGSRPGDAIYYIDGVKMTSMTTVPGAAIGSMEAYTGGIPAKYGDTTGGVVVLESKSYFDLYYAWKARMSSSN